MENEVEELAAAPKNFPPLDQETRTAIPINAAAFYLSRSPHTLYAWSSHENGPIKPVRINGRLLWRVADIKAALNG